MIIKSYTAEVRVSFHAVTDKGREIHDCVVLPLSLIKPTQTNFEKMRDAALVLIGSRIQNYETQQDTVEELIKNQPEPTREERLAQALDKIDPTDIPALKEYLNSLE